MMTAPGLRVKLDGAMCVVVTHDAMVVHQSEAEWMAKPSYTHTR